MRRKNQKGQTMVEYALIIALVAIALVAALGTFRGQIGDFLASIGNNLPAVNQGGDAGG